MPDRVGEFGRLEPPREEGAIDPLRQLSLGPVEHDLVARIVSDDEITAAIHNPPQDTRAYFRGECRRRFPDEVFGVNWDSISFGIGDQPIKRVMMVEPLKGSKLLVSELLDRSTTAAELVENLSA